MEPELENLVQADFINVEIGVAGQFTEANVKIAAQGFMFATSVTSPTTVVAVSIGGYDDDPRELWDIEEARKYILRFAHLISTNGIRPSKLFYESWELIKACVAKEEGKSVSLNKNPPSHRDMIRRDKDRLRSKLN